MGTVSQTDKLVMWAGIALCWSDDGADLRPQQDADRWRL